MLRDGESLATLIISTIIEIGGGESGTRKASELSVVTALKKKGYEESKVEGYIRKLKEEGRLMEPVNGLLRVI